ncbi:hypothetical protein M3Y98_01201500 [Aphelenchoides besseyi]|nr:hypothetical protein M3Y98_01201500 [Aphelenchoides besseyi]KAI6193110.1 hypothetical protein M3Y96_00983500 [Aphelenchoides besseyi]
MITELNFSILFFVLTSDAVGGHHVFDPTCLELADQRERTVGCRLQGIRSKLFSKTLSTYAASRLLFTSTASRVKDRCPSIVINRCPHVLLLNCRAVKNSSITGNLFELKVVGIRTAASEKEYDLRKDILELDIAAWIKSAEKEAVCFFIRVGCYLPWIVLEIMNVCYEGEKKYSNTLKFCFLICEPMAVSLAAIYSIYI